MKKKVLWYSDSPTVTTGFGNVAKNIIQKIGNDVDITIVGINSDGHFYDQKEYPCKIIPAFSFSPMNQDGDIYGKNKLLSILQQEDWDYLFIMQDTFVVKNLGEQIAKIRDEKQKMTGKTFKFVYYFPADLPFHPNWIINSIMVADIPVSYNKCGVEFVLDQQKNIPQVKDKEIKIIHHGVNKDVFKPVSEEEKDAFREKYFNGKVSKDDFLIINVNRNQPRKDLARTLMAFKYIKQELPNAKLYTHCVVDEGIVNLIEVARRIGLDNKDMTWLYPHPMVARAGQGMPEEQMNLLYNVASLNVSTSLGEGWGLSSTEAMMTKTPNLMPDNTSFPEIIGENEERGYMCKSGNTPSHFTMLGGQDNNAVRPITDVDSFVDKVIHIYKHEEERGQKAEAAYNWACENLNWETIAKEWLDVFSS